MLPHFVCRTLIISFAAKGNELSDLLKIQYTPCQNNSSLPSFAFKTDKHMATLNITEDSISNIIKSLNPNNSHCWGGDKFYLVKWESYNWILKANL